MEKSRAAFIVRAAESKNFGAEVEGAAEGFARIAAIARELDVEHYNTDKAVQLVKRALLESWIEGQQWPNREAWAEHHAKIAVQALL